MTFLDRLNAALDVIEDNLTEQVELDDIAAAAATSTFQFQRMFSLIAGVPLAEYIRRRRLTLAAFELQSSDSRILDIAVKYGYDSHEAFTRAFQKCHGIPPSLARRKGHALKAYPRLTFTLTIKGDKEMDYRIEKKDAFKMFGMEKLVAADPEENVNEIPLFWQDSFQNGAFDKLYEASCKETDLGDEIQLPVHGIMCYEDTGKKTVPYMIGAFLKDGTSPGNHKVVTIPGKEWALFRTEPYADEQAPEKIQDLWKRIYSEWFPTSGYEQDGEGPQLEVYYQKPDKKEFCEIWIPVKRTS
jgi:AraC family transcriptional regulator